ncbi:hypothetical protein WN944_000983 [Citrus x changshan-huyou]|uniref:Uncharacterized protein n=1 Tax=Citrus x changshan-huyou TaxID=2935761 RepID=A0AAP0MGD3_9ROSI
MAHLAVIGNSFNFSCVRKCLLMENVLLIIYVIYSYRALSLHLLAFSFC